MNAPHNDSGPQDLSAVYESWLAELQATFQTNLWLIPFQSDLKGFLAARMDELKDLASAYGVQDASCCIKLLVSLDQRDPLDWSVSTFARDTDSERQRATIDHSVPRFRVRDNSAFAEVCQGKPYYLCNDLQKSNFKCANPRWIEFYNATLIVPIGTRFLSRHPQPPTGLICIDSLEGPIPLGLANYLQWIGVEISHLFGEVSA